MTTNDKSTQGNLGGFKLLRGQMKEGQCPECATKHEPWQAHNQQSLYWQYSFREKHGRWPTWADAIAHCDQKLQDTWIEELKKYGIEVKR